MLSLAVLFVTDSVGSIISQNCPRGILAKLGDC